MMPASSSATIAASCRRSTVHHHSLMGFRCSRESMGIPKGVCPLVAHDGFQEVNGIVISGDWVRRRTTNGSHISEGGIRYAAASMIEPQRLWNAGPPAFAGD